MCTEISPGAAIAISVLLSVLVVVNLVFVYRGHAGAIVIARPFSIDEDSDDQDTIPVENSVVNVGSVARE